MSDESIYLKTLCEGTTPFERFVARRDIRDVVDVAAPRKHIDEAVLYTIDQTVQDHACRLLPILGGVGSGKTHAYWAYKDMEAKAREAATATAAKKRDKEVAAPPWSIVYVPCPLPPAQILQHIHTCIINELGREILDACSMLLITRWGGAWDKGKKKEIDAVIANGLKEFPGSYADGIKVLATYAMDKARRPLAERWLFGDDLKGKDLEVLEVKSTMASDEACIAMLKLIAGNAGRVLVMFFDDFFEAVVPAQERKIESRFLDILRVFYSEVKNTVLLLTDNPQNWPTTVALADKNLRSFMATPLELKPFTLGDVKLFFAEAMASYWRENNLNPPQAPLFPLNDTIMEVIFRKTKGNPRNTVKLARIFVEKVVNGDVTLAEIAEDKVPVSIGPVEPQPRQKTTPATVPAPATTSLTESEIVDKLQKIFRVSDRLPVAQLAQVLRMEVPALWDKIFDWADKYRFRIDKDVLVVAGGDVTSFLSDLGTQK